MPKKSTELSTQISEETLALLKDSFPVETSFQRTLLPRISLVSQDVTEGKGKAMKVITEAGTFLQEHQTDELDEKGKKKWSKDEIGTDIEVIIFYRRHQLKFYDGVSYTSSPVYDEENEVVPLFKDKAEVDRGTPAELKARPAYQGTTAKGKPTSKLEDNRVLYVLYKDEVHQMNLRGNSMYAFMAYMKTTVVPSVVTRISSEPKENGAIAWNQCTFEVSRKLNEDEARDVLLHVKDVQDSIKNEKAFFAAQTPKTDDQKALEKEASKF